jgi:glycerate dehydrogenase
MGERLRGVQVAVVNKIKMNADTLGEAKDLRLICVAATGFDNIDTAYCQERGIAVCNVPAYSTESVAQLTVSMALTLVTHLTEYRQFVHSGAYSKSDTANRLTPVYHELSTLTWGVVGGGGIGTRVAEMAKALGFRVVMCRRKPETRFDSADIDTLCGQADIVSLHVPLSDETRHLINQTRLAQMKDGAILINVARGAVTDEAAVARAVRDGRIGGFGCDVYSREPFHEDHPFYSIIDSERVCLTPHMAWGSFEARTRCVETMAANIRSFVSGGRDNRIV